MSPPLTYLFVTVKDRFDLAERSIGSLLDSTDSSQYRLLVCIDGGLFAPPSFWKLIEGSAHWIHRAMTCPHGLGPTINSALAHFAAVHRFASDQRCPDPGWLAPLVTMAQDDVLYTDGWLPTLACHALSDALGGRIGFVTGHEAVEHPRMGLIDGGPAFLAQSIRATMMMARIEYWMSMWPIPRFDIETGRVRGQPNDGVGSSVDWHFLRDHPESVQRTGRCCVVVPGLIRHLGHDRSTWLDRPLPESPADIASMTQETMGSIR